MIRLASSRCYAEFSEVYDTQPLPDELTFDTPRIPSDRNSKVVLDRHFDVDLLATHVASVR